MLYEYRFDGIYIRHAIDDCPDDKNFIMHIHDQFEIYFFITGNVEYLVEGSKYPLKDGTLMIMRPAESHKPSIIGDERYERYAVHFSRELVTSIDPEGILTKAFTERPLGKGNMLLPHEFDTEAVLRLFVDMCADNDDYSKRLTIKTHLFMLLHLISRAYSASADQTLSNRQLGISERIISYTNKHLFDDISIPQLARRFYLSSSQFARIFKGATGATPWEYITKKRLTAAKEKIKSGTPARKASEECGFKDYSAFYRAYVKHFGYSPRGDGEH